MSYDDKERKQLIARLVDYMKNPVIQDNLKDKSPDEEYKIAKSFADAYLKPYDDEKYGHSHLAFTATIDAQRLGNLTTVDVATVELAGKLFDAHFAGLETEPGPKR